MSDYWQGAILALLVPTGPWSLDGDRWYRDFIDEDSDHIFRLFAKERVNELT